MSKKVTCTKKNVVAGVGIAGSLVGLTKRKRRNVAEKKIPKEKKKVDKDRDGSIVGPHMTKNCLKGERGKRKWGGIKNQGEKKKKHRMAGRRGQKLETRPRSGKWWFLMEKRGWNRRPRGKIEGVFRNGKRQKKAEARK